MQVTETLSEGLKREYKVVVPAAELDAKVNARLDEMKDRVRINGFRPGKVPVTHLKRMYGRSAMAEVIEATVRDTNNQIVSERGYKLAADPKVTLPTDEGAIEQLIAGKTDLNYTMALEIVPPIALADFKSIKLTKLTADVTDGEIEQGVARIVDQNKPYAARPEGEKAAKDDRVTISFAGTIDGKPFEGGSGDDAVVLIGSNTFIPGFEDQLIGIATGETRTVKVTFPANYMKQDLAGKAAEFVVTAKSIEAPGTVTADDDFAKSLGLESIAKLRETVKDSIAREHVDSVAAEAQARAARRARHEHKFDPPPRLVEEEFERVWKSVLTELENERQDFRRRGYHRRESQGRVPRHCRAAGPARAGARRDRREEQYHRHRGRVEPRGNGAGAPVRRPGAAGVGLLPQNPQAVAALRAPIFEEKVVDFLLELAARD